MPFVPPDPPSIPAPPTPLVTMPAPPTPLAASPAAPAELMSSFPSPWLGSSDPVQAVTKSTTPTEMRTSALLRISRLCRIADCLRSRLRAIAFKKRVGRPGSEA